MSSLNLKIIILIIIMLGLAAGVGFGAYNFFLPKLPANNENLAPVDLAPIVENLNQAPVVENLNQAPVIFDFSNYPGDEKLWKKAASEGNTKYCDQTVAMKKDDCLYLAAANIGIEGCQQINDQAIKTKCLEYFASRKAMGEKDLNGCLALTVQEFRSECLLQLYVQQNDLAYCKDLQAEDKVLCEDLINKNIAIKTADINACSSIQDVGIKGDCVNIVKNLPLDQDKDGLSDDSEKSYGTNLFKADSDGDGLSDYDEIFKYKTNPTKADTDGDGYSDGDEVKNGYNPLGN